ncbi:hypothetical protein BMS3Bbin14_01774 [bacterium BMS3Bbin14]|nr:hypothetical protein BMS3Bbin14_01774 [bacterium BMS3Bbin14]
MHLFVNNATNSTYCLGYCLKPSRIDEFVFFGQAGETNKYTSRQDRLALARP